MSDARIIQWMSTHSIVILAAIVVLILIFAMGALMFDDGGL